MSVPLQSEAKAEFIEQTRRKCVSKDAGKDAVLRKCSAVRQRKFRGLQLVGLPEGQLEVTFDESLTAHVLCQDEEDVLALNDALGRLQTMSPRQSQLVEGRFFGGLSWAESAELLDLSESTVMREWRSARAWLASEVKRSLTHRQGASADGH